ncbi:MAG: DUF177 domain-containing protein [Saprospiraceae bacterium]|nr:DUF177 domain-containing protein [Pyrinomonadaceae bacterium]
MIIDLGNLEGSLQFDFSVTADELDLGTGDFRLLSDAKAAGEVLKHIAQTDVVGTINADAEFDCTRCLSPVRQDFVVAFDVAYITEIPEAATAEIEPGDLDTDLLADESLDLKEVVREQILLNLPEQIFCKEDCRGLCQKCGANRNLINCICEEKEIDPRWSALKNLK